MAVPKRRHSKGRLRRKRNSHYFEVVASTVVCENCKSQKLPHRVCPSCGE